MSTHLSPQAAPAAPGDVSPDWRRVRRLLAVRLDDMGDLLMTTPALAALRAGAPGAHITLLCSPAGAALAPSLPSVDAVVECQPPWMKTAAGRESGALGQAERALMQTLAAGAYDAAVIFTVATQSALPAALMCRMAGIPLRLAHARENPYGLLSDWVRDTDTVADGMRHEVQRQVDLVRHLGWVAPDTRLQMRLSAAAREVARVQLQAAGLAAGTPYLVVHVGASASSRRWPAQRYGAVVREVARELSQERSGLAFVFVGEEDERPLVDEARDAAAGARCIDLSGRLPLGALGAVIEGAELLLGNNSGPMHMAAALGVPVVVLYALTNPQHTPWQVPARVLNEPVPCRHCLQSRCPLGTQDCLQRVRDPHVVAAVLELLQPDRGVAARHPKAISPATGQPVRPPAAWSAA